MDSPVPILLARLVATDPCGELLSIVSARALRTILASSLQNSHVDEITENIITGMFGHVARSRQFFFNEL